MPYALMAFAMFVVLPVGMSIISYDERGYATDPMAVFFVLLLFSILWTVGAGMMMFGDAPPAEA